MQGEPGETGPEGPMGPGGDPGLKGTPGMQVCVYPQDYHMNCVTHSVRKLSFVFFEIL